MRKLKILFFAVTISAFLISCNSANTEEKAPNDTPKSTDLIPTKVVENPTQITFEKDTHDFGEIIQDEVVTTNFKFTNTGTSDLIISNARGSCGCTVPDWPKEPVAPGESSNIKVEFNSKNRSGAFNKTVTVTANTTPGDTRLYIKGTIIVPQDKK